MDAGPSRQHPDKPAYQHRQRPDAPAQTAASRQFNRAVSSDAAARRMSAIMAAETPAAGADQAPVEPRQTSAGSTSGAAGLGNRPPTNGLATPANNVSFSSRIGCLIKVAHFLSREQQSRATVSPHER